MLFSEQLTTAPAILENLTLPPSRFYICIEIVLYLDQILFLRPQNPD
jgi:hypothetical protein